MNLGARLRLAGEIVGAYAQARRALRHRPLPDVVADLRGGAATVDADRPDAGPRLARAVVRTLEPLPLDSRCLMRSLVLLRLLARRGVAGRLVIAVTPNQSDQLAAHAWVELDGRPLLAPGGFEDGRLLTL